jgi:hypothetical protein
MPKKTSLINFAPILGLGWVLLSISAHAATSCQDNITVTHNNNTYCLNYFPELPKVSSGKHNLLDAAFSHPSLHVSASQKSCGGLVGFAWGAGDRTGQKAIEYCEIKLSKRYSKTQITQMGCKCEVYLVPGKARGNFVLVKEKDKFLSALNLSDPERKMAGRQGSEKDPKAAEADRQRQAQAEADRQRQAQAEADRQRQAQAEADRQRQAQAEADRQRQAQAEADRQRQAQAEVKALLEAQEQLAKAQAKRLAMREAELAHLREKLASRADSVNKTPPASTGSSTVKLGELSGNNPRKALVLGNDNYSQVSALKNAVADAKAMAKRLSGLGYAVTTSFDSSRRKMLETIRNFSYNVQGGDEVVFFYAGHGVELSGQNYLLPTDIRGDDPRQVQDDAIELQRVLNDMSQSRAKFTLAVVDACRDNPFKSAGRAIGGRGLAPTTAATGQMVIFSAGSGQQALDRLGESDKNPNGLFTRVFIEEMTQPNVPIDRVVKKVRKRVVDMAATVGHQQVPAIYDQVIGDFFFVKR